MIRRSESKTKFSNALNIQIEIQQAQSAWNIISVAKLINNKQQKQTYEEGVNNCLISTHLNVNVFD